MAVVERDHVVVMVAGKVRAGKSTALNNLFKPEVPFRAGPHHKSLTRDIEEFTVVKNNVALRIIDTPGMGALLSDLKSKEVLKKMSKLDVNTKKFCLLYCFSVSNESIIGAQDEIIIRNLTALFGDSIWKRCTLVMTHCDSLRREEYPSTEAENKYLGILRSHLHTFEETLGKLGVKNIPVKLCLDLKRGEDVTDTILAVPAAKTKEVDTILTQECAEENADWTEYAYKQIMKKTGEYALTFIRLRYNLIAVTAGAGGGFMLAAASCAVGAAIGIAGGPPGIVAGAIAGAATGGILGGSVLSGSTVISLLESFFRYQRAPKDSRKVTI